MFFINLFAALCNSNVNIMSLIASIHENITSLYNHNVYLQDYGQSHITFVKTLHKMSLVGSE